MCGRRQRETYNYQGNEVSLVEAQGGQPNIWNTNGIERPNGEHGQGSTGESNFLCSEYNNRDSLEADDTNSWGGNHSCGTREMTIMGDTWGRH